MSSEQRRKVLVAREDLVNAFSLVAKKRGSTLYALTNEVLEQALRADSMGASLREVLDVYEIMRANRSAGQTLISVEVLVAMTSKLDPKSYEEVEKLWRESGRWYGEYLTIRFRDSFKDSSSKLQQLERFLKEVRWELVDLVVHQEGDGIRVRCVSPQLPVEVMRFLSAFIEGVLEAFGYMTERRNIFKGIIDIYAKPLKT
ncbi:MAG: hypothetical protein JHC33_15245 [Ignisphaera sp.]|nr:hypothetical protein [Ignisphaera sp.]